MINKKLTKKWLRIYAKQLGVKPKQLMTEKKCPRCSMSLNKHPLIPSFKNPCKFPDDEDKYLLDKIILAIQTENKEMLNEAVKEILKLGGGTNASNIGTT